MSQHIPLWLSSCGLICLAAGCSRTIPAYPVQGKVQFADGTPVLVGSVEFRSLEHRIQARGEIGPQGSFQITTYAPDDGAVAGKHQCVVVQMVLSEEFRGAQDNTWGVVHPRFGSYATAGLNCEVRANGANPITLVVEGLSPQRPVHKH